MWLLTCKSTFLYESTAPSSDYMRLKMRLKKKSQNLSCHFTIQPQTVPSRELCLSVFYIKHSAFPQHSRNRTREDRGKKHDIPQLSRMAGKKHGSVLTLHVLPEWLFVPSFSLSPQRTCKVNMTAVLGNTARQIRQSFSLARVFICRPQVWAITGNYTL